MTKIAIFASGSGSNFQAIVEAMRTGDARISVEICHLRPARSVLCDTG